MGSCCTGCTLNVLYGVYSMYTNLTLWGPCKEEKEVQLLERSHDPSPRSGQGETLLLAVGLCVFWYPVKIDLVGVALLLILRYLLKYFQGCFEMGMFPSSCS